MAGRRLLRVMPPLRQYTRAPFIAFPWETSPHPRDAPPRFPKKLTVPRPQSPPDPTRHPSPSTSIGQAHEADPPPVAVPDENLEAVVMELAELTGTAG